MREKFLCSSCVNTNCHLCAGPARVRVCMKYKKNQTEEAYDGSAKRGRRSLEKRTKGAEMRKSAYLKAIDEAKSLPTKIPNLRSYFNDGYSPRQAALHYLITKARKDLDLFDGEFIDICEKQKEGVITF